jgi:2-hydroxychromene-2-carboxylate isomerase
METAVSRPKVEIWFEFGSNYSYPSVHRIGSLARKRGIELLWEPFLLGPIFKSLGWSTSPFVLQEAKGRYMWRDMERQCEKYGLPWTRPSTFPRRALLPMRVAVAGKTQLWIEEFCKEMMTLNFAKDTDIDSIEVVGRVLEGLGVNPEEMIEQAQTPENKELLKLQTERAQALGIFGGPTFVTRGELFWGNDRLDEALEWATKEP